MSDRPIALGDLVMVVHTHCPNKWLGTIYRVGYLGRAFGSCFSCRHLIGEYAYAGISEFEQTTPLKWLKRIDPLSEPESVERKEEIPA